MKTIKFKFKIGSYKNCFKVTPCFQITYCGYGIEPGFAIELTWFIYGIGLRIWSESKPT